jgi:iron complex outermembrane receptor protein
MIRSSTFWAGIAAMLASGICQAAETSQNVLDFHIDPQSLDQAIRRFSEQTQIQSVVAVADGGTTVWSNGVHGPHTPEGALAELLAGSTLTYEFEDAESVRIIQAHQERDPQRLALEDIQDALPEILVEGKKTINMDIRRDVDDALSWIVIERREIEQSPAGSIEELLTQRVPSLLPGLPQGGAGTSLEGDINLRGLGADDTLVLIDGRRLAPSFIGLATSQPDMRSIPPGAIERIEILPTSASGIYGGSATAGVVNIILRHECQDPWMKIEYASSLSFDTPRRDLSLSHCLNVIDGRTTLTLMADASDQQALLARDRGFVKQGRARIANNNPKRYENGAPPPLGAQPNISSSDGSGLFGPESPSFVTLPPGFDASNGLDSLREFAGHYSLDLANSAAPEGGARAVLRDPLSTRYVNATLRQHFTAALSAFVDLTASRSKVVAPGSCDDYVGLSNAFVPASANLFGRDLRVTTSSPLCDGRVQNRLSSRRVTAGLNFHSANSWSFNVEYTAALWTSMWSRPAGVAATEDIASGRLYVFQDTSVEPLDVTPYRRDQYTSPLASDTEVISLRAGGPVPRWLLPPLLRGSRTAPTLLVLAEHRHERFRGGREYLSATDQSLAATTASFSAQERSIDSLYSEALIPLWEPNGVRRLGLSMAARVDTYRAHTAPPRVLASSREPIVPGRSSFSTANPTIAFRYRASPSILLRASAAAGFRPPAGDELAPPSPRLFPADFLPHRPDGARSGLIEVLSGGNPALRPERSRSRSAGIILEPVALPTLHLSLDYTSILKTGEIVRVSDLLFSDLTRFETLYPERVTHDATGAITAIDATTLNAAETRVLALDSSLLYEIPDFRLGSLRLSATTTWQPVFERRATAASRSENDAGVSASSPLRFNAVGNIVLSRGRWTWGWSTRFYHSYRVSRSAEVIESQGGREVRGQIFHDAFVGVHFATHAVLPTSVDVQLKLQNVFNERPSFDAGEPLTGYWSRFGDPRLMACSLSIAARM